MTTTNGTNDEVTEATLAGQTAANDDAVAMDGENGNGDGPPNGVVSNPMPGNVRAADIVGEMQNAYLDYAMSVIVARALPDVRDGLKPVHRRILYAMSHDLYLHHTKPHRKSARIVGEVLGKYHPHGDVAVYDAMVRMAQDFSLRYPLVDGQGNFGSIDGDGAAAMRYTEARLAEIAELMLTDLDKDTVGWHDNFDNSLEEPDVLPAALPNLLINGSSGIAVGMATNIPPHNLNEIVDALVYLIDHYSGVEEITVDELLQFVKGPDFPTGGILYRFREDKVDENTDVIAQGYSMGKARLVMQAKAHFEEMSRGRSRIVVTELPYQTNKTALIERIASLARDAKIEGITDLRDESDRTGMRIVIELTRNADPKDILKDLFKYTPLQQTFGMQMLALVDGQPRLLSLKRALHLFVQHREEIIRRRSEYDLAKARDRAHIVEGLLKALDILDEVIDTIRRSQTVETARNNLVKNFKFTEIQAQAILDMQLRRLAALERKKLKDEHDELLARIAYLEDLLAHPEKILAVIREELLAQKEKYGDARRTQIVDRTKGTLTTTDLLPQQEVWVTVSADGELRRQDVSKPSVAIMRQLAKHGQVAMLTANTRLVICFLP
ncbi:MAG: DNA topoisomerase (ATP-hydrolyzing) [Caldilineaceae bacterium]